MNSLKVIRKEWSDTFCFLVCETDFEGKVISLGKSVEMQKHEPGSYIADGTFELPARMAQSLINELWSLGLRPTEAKYPQGELNATKAHLEDMRTLVFKRDA